MYDFSSNLVPNPKQLVSILCEGMKEYQLEEFRKHGDFVHKLENIKKKTSGRSLSFSPLNLPACVMTPHSEWRVSCTDKLLHVAEELLGHVDDHVDDVHLPLLNLAEGGISLGCRVGGSEGGRRQVGTG